MPERGEKRFYASGGDILAKKKHRGTEPVSSWVKYPGGLGAGPQGKDEGGAPC